MGQESTPKPQEHYLAEKNMPQDSKTLTWISEHGGPLLLLSTELLPYWEGSSVPSEGRIIEARFRWAGPGTPATDYDRACDVDDYLGLIEVGNGRGLVLGGEPFLAAWYSEKGTRQAGTLIRWISANDEPSILHALTQALSVRDIWQREEFAFPVGQQPLCLFAATIAGNDLEADDCLVVELDPGIYRIATTYFEPDTNTSVLLHHLNLHA